MRHKAIIETNGIKGKITIDGNEISGVTGYTITHRAGNIPELTLKLNCDLQVIGKEVLIPLPEPWRRIYERNAAPETNVYDFFEQLAQNCDEGKCDGCGAQEFCYTAPKSMTAELINQAIEDMMKKPIKRAVTLREAGH